MSPSRTRKPVAKIRSRREIAKAVGGAVGVVLATALLVWLIRPGARQTIGRGGLLTRQPRATWLVLIAIGVAGFGIRWILRHRRARSRRKVLIPIVVALVLVGSIGAAWAWPGGLVRHWPAIPKAPPDTEPPSGTSTPTSGPDSTIPATDTGAATTTPGTATGETAPPTTGSP